MKLANYKDFEQIVREYQHNIINFHYRFTGNRFEAEDLAQETFIKAYKKLHTLKEPEKLKSWLFHIEPAIQLLISSEKIKIGPYR